MENELHMKRAIELAKRGRGWVSPNPLVGAVIVKNGRVIAEGYHARAGQAHAERDALAHCTESPRGAALYVTLEPCCHHGRTPPCTDAILEAGIAHVIIGSRDPNPKVAGKGAAILREAGVQVTEDFMRDACDALNPIFFHYIRTRTPYVAMKYAMTADGKIATRTGASKWITGEDARAHVQALRHTYRGIMVGIGTVLADDPLLTCRLPEGRNPIRIVCDSSLRIPLGSALCRTAGEIPTIVATASEDAAKRQALEACGVQVLYVPGADGKTDLSALLSRLGEMEVDSILLEGGGTLNYEMLAGGFVHEVHAFIAPKLFGGAQAKSPVEGEGISLPDNCIRLSSPVVSTYGEDLLLSYRTIKEDD